MDVHSKDKHFQIGKYKKLLKKIKRLISHRLEFYKHISIYFVKTINEKKMLYLTFGEYFLFKLA